MKRRSQSGRTGGTSRKATTRNRVTSRRSTTLRVRSPRAGKAQAKTASKSASKSKARSAGKSDARRTSSRAKTGSTRGRAQGKTSGSRSTAQLTTDHDEIRQWVEERGGHPATVTRSSKSRDKAGILRVDFPGFSGKASLKPVTWEEWFRVFDERRLGFLYQDTTTNGKKSRFNKLICRT